MFGGTPRRRSSWPSALPLLSWTAQAGHRKGGGFLKDPWTRALVGLVFLALLMVAASFLSSRLRDERTALETLTAEGDANRSTTSGESAEAVGGMTEATSSAMEEAPRPAGREAGPDTLTARAGKDAERVAGDLVTSAGRSGGEKFNAPVSDADADRGGATSSPSCLAGGSNPDLTAASAGGEGGAEVIPKAESKSVSPNDGVDGLYPSEEETRTSGPSGGGADGSLSVSLLKMSLGLAAVVALILTIRRIASRRGSKGRFPGEGRLQVVGYTPLGPSCGIYEVKVGGRVLLVGEAEKGLSLLGELDAEELVTAEEAELMEDEFLKLLREEMEGATAVRARGRRPLVEELRWRSSRPVRRRRP